MAQVMSRRKDESVEIGGRVTVTVVQLRGDKAMIQVDAPGLVIRQVEKPCGIVQRPETVDTVWGPMELETAEWEEE